MFADAPFKLYLKRRMMVAGNVILEQVTFCINQRWTVDMNVGQAGILNFN